jgi:hypothetical protein
MHDRALMPANPVVGASRASPGIGALLARASTLTVVASAGQPPGMRASMHAGMRATRVPGAKRSSQAANCWVLTRLVITRGGRGCDPHLPDLADCDMETRAVETCPRQGDPGGSGLQVP